MWYSQASPGILTWACISEEQSWHSVRISVTPALYLAARFDTYRAGPYVDLCLCISHGVILAGLPGSEKEVVKGTSMALAISSESWEYAKSGLSVQAVQSCNSEHLRPDAS